MGEAAGSSDRFEARRSAPNILFTKLLSSKHSNGGGGSPNFGLMPNLLGYSRTRRMNAVIRMDIV